MFRHSIIAATLAISLAGCAAMPGGIGAPVAIADRTVLDEKAVIGAELAYKAFRLAGGFAIEANVLKGAKAAKVAALDKKAFKVLGAARRAYDTGNAASYDVAVREAIKLIGEASAVVASR